jgi:hypothetical protein
VATATAMAGEFASVDGPSTLAFFASVFVSVFPSAIALLHLLRRNPRNHGRKNGSICVFGENRLFMVRREKNGGQHATSGEAISTYILF